MKWIKAGKDNLPKKDWPYCVKHDGGGADYYETMLPEELLAAIEANKKSDYHIDYYWLDESPIPSNNEDELTKEGFFKLIGADWKNAQATVIWDALKYNGYHITKKQNHE